MGHSEGEFTRNTDFNGSEIYDSHKINLHQNIKWILVYIVPIGGQIYKIVNPGLLLQGWIYGTLIFSSIFLHFLEF